MLPSSPILNYIGSCDTSNITDGSVLFSILFDAGINLLMFEYKIQKTGTTTAPTNLTTGFIHTDTCTQSGITNQYTIPIPAVPSDYDAESVYTVSIRAYDSTTGQATMWSNELDMHYPPAKPVVVGAYYDNLQPYGYYDDVLYVLFDNSFNPTNEAIVAYYYTDYYGQVQWQVTPPTSVTPSATNGYYVQIPLSNDVSLNQPIYVAAHSAYSWSQGLNNYFAISEITETIQAEPGQYVPPVLNSLVYNVYTTRAQTMTLNWSAPTSVDVSIFIVDYYLINIYNADGDLMQTINTNNDLTTYDVDVSAYGCGEELTFGIVAVNMSSVETGESNRLSQFIYYYATGPVNLNVGYGFKPTSTTLDVQFSFQNPIFLGCGTPQNFKCVVHDLSGNAYGTLNVPYDADTVTYIGDLNDMVVPATLNSYLLTVSLGTTNTNIPNEILYGGNSQSPINVTNVPIIDNVILYGSSLTFRVTTPSLLVRINNVILSYDTSGPTVVDWYAQSVGGNVVSEITDANGNIIYQIRVDLSAYDTPDRIIVNAANSTAGIGNKLHNVL